MVQYDGILLCHKPFGVSSHDVIVNLRQVIGQRRMGHTGTLDPLATGLMLICLGRATKIAQFLSDMDKTYEAEIKLGVRSSTFDAEGVIENDPPQPVPNLSKAEMEDIFSEFRGSIRQKVPAFSAIKRNGQRLYKAARMGKKVNPPERNIEIKEIKLIGINLPFVNFVVCCSKGTYIRSLANDIGEKIGCGAYLFKLSRIKVGDFTLQEALTPNEIKYYCQAGTLKRYLKSIEMIVAFPSIQVSEEFAPLILVGRQPRMKDITAISGDFARNDHISLIDQTGKIMAIGKAGLDSSDFRNSNGQAVLTYVRVLN